MLPIRVINYSYPEPIKNVKETKIFNLNDGINLIEVP